MLIKNRIIELFEDDIKVILYSALKDNKNIMYTRNGRSTPVRTKLGIDNVYTIESNNQTYTIVIDADKQQLEYFDYKILDIKRSIEKDVDISSLKNFLNDNNKDYFIGAIDSSQFSFSSQYDTNTVYKYILEVV